MKRYLGFLLIIVTVFFVACGDSGSSNPVGPTPEVISVILLSPVNGATDQDTSLAFSWSGTDSTYDVYLGTNSLNLGKIASDLKTTSYTQSGLSKGTIYYWKVIGKTGSASGESVVRSFITKIDVNLVSPDSGALDQNRSLTFKWSGKADKYDIYFGLDSLNLNTVVRDLSTTSYTKTDFNTSTTYYWKVVGKTGGEVDTSSVWKFTTAKIYVSPLSPSEGATAQDTNVTLIWGSNADKYTIYMGTDNNSFDVIGTDLTDTFFEKSGLSKNTTYYWKLVASGDGKIVFSENRSFTTKINVELSSPANQALNQNTSVDLTWACIASSYDVYFGTDSSNLTTAIATDISTKTFTKSGLTEGTTYYWKVVGKKGSELDTSDVWKFTTKISVSLSSPADGATYLPTDTTFTWSGTATTYDFYLGTSSSNLSKIASDLTTPSFPKNGLEEVTTYYWKVVGKKDNQTVESPVRSFFTKSNISFAMALVEAGTFNMGADGFNDAKPIHSVTISKNYYIGKYEVTNAEVVKVYNQAKKKGISGLVFSSVNVTYNNVELLRYTDGITRQIEFSNDSLKALKGNYPAIWITWYGADAFVKFLDSITGSHKYRLPTEAEWEFAARGGSKSENYTFSGSNTLSEVGWYNGKQTSENILDAGFGTSEVGKLKANELGIYDMSGNVMEWCSDWYGSYSADAQTDPTGPSTGTNRIKRNSWWLGLESECHVARRDRAEPTTYYNNIGFRIVKEY